jgi:hemerythrin-like metal-binding protein
MLRSPKCSCALETEQLARARLETFYWEVSVALIEWADSLSIGIPSIDEQHKKLVSLINELHNAMLERKAKDVMGRIFEELIEYTRYHFSLEEEMLREHGHPEEANHANEHRVLAEKVFALKEEFDQGNTAVTLEVMRFLRDWLGNHIVGTDKKYAPLLIARGVV